MEEFDRHSSMEITNINVIDGENVILGDGGDDDPEITRSASLRLDDALGNAPEDAFKGEHKAVCAGRAYAPDECDDERSSSAAEASDLDFDEGDDDELGDEDQDEPPAVSRKVRRRRKRSRPRSKTIAMKRLTREELKRGALLYPPVDVPRPSTRAECEVEMRPCPWVACKHHLYLDVNPVTGSIKINFPDLDPWDLPQTCALDVAERGGITLEEVGEIMNLTRERIRQVEVRGLNKIRMSSPSPEELGAHMPLEDDE